MERYGNYIVSAPLVAAAKLDAADLILLTSAEGESLQITIPGAALAWNRARTQTQPPAPGWMQISATTWANFSRYAICDVVGGHVYTPEGIRITLSADAMAAAQSLLQSLPDLLA